VLTGGKEDTINHYDTSSKIPCQNLGFGGLGSYWHGVIPMHSSDTLPAVSEALIADLFRIFYPREELGNLTNSSWLFVPYRPIRPKPHWIKLEDSLSGNLRLAHTVAQKIYIDNGKWVVVADGQYLRTHRLWLAAGALGSPAILEQSEEYSSATLTGVSDHLILYAGQVNRKVHSHIASPQVKHTASGYWMRSSADFGDLGLITTKPARFAYKTLDQGIEQRSAFGLPTSGIIKKVISAGSLGFIAESVFNKFGLFPNSEILSVYAQIRVESGFRRLPGGRGVQADEARILSCIQNFRENLNQLELTLSRRSDLYIRGIHMHGTIDARILRSFEINTDASNCVIVDSSVIDDIGPEHHSFRLMVRAFERARNS